MTRKRSDVSAEEVARLYVDEGLRTTAIARLLGCNNALVLSRLAEAGVPRSRRARLSASEITRLYVEEQLSTAAIAAKFSVSRSTISRLLQESGVALRRTGPPTKPVIPCPRSLTFKAYLAGFVWGDVNVTLSPSGERVYLKMNTTQAAQSELFLRLFSQFGTVRQSESTLRALLGRDFEFLLMKVDGEIPEWISGAAVESAFAAGYIDAEGSFGIYEDRGRFKVDSYDEAVLLWLSCWLRTIGVRAVHRRVAAKGDERPTGYRFNGDLWRVNVNESMSLLRLIATLDPFVRHQGRRTAMERVAHNVRERLRARDPVSPPSLIRNHQPH